MKIKTPTQYTVLIYMRDRDAENLTFNAGPEALNYSCYDGLIRFLDIDGFSWAFNKDAVSYISFTPTEWKVEEIEVLGK